MEKVVVAGEAPVRPADTGARECAAACHSLVRAVEALRTATQQLRATFESACGTLTAASDHAGWSAQRHSVLTACSRCSEETDAVYASIDGTLRVASTSGLPSSVLVVSLCRRVRLLVQAWCGIVFDAYMCVSDGLHAPGAGPAADTHVALEALHHSALNAVVALGSIMDAAHAQGVPASVLAGEGQPFLAPFHAHSTEASSSTQHAARLTSLMRVELDTRAAARLAPVFELASLADRLEQLRADTHTHSHTRDVADGLRALMREHMVSFATAEASSLQACLEQLRRAEGEGESLPQFKSVAAALDSAADVWMRMMNAHGEDKSALLTRLAANAETLKSSLAQVQASRYLDQRMHAAVLQALYSVRVPLAVLVKGRRSDLDELAKLTSMWVDLGRHPFKSASAEAPRSGAVGDVCAAAAAVLRVHAQRPRLHAHHAAWISVVCSMAQHMCFAPRAEQESGTCADLVACRDLVKDCITGTQEAVTPALLRSWSMAWWDCMVYTRSTADAGGTEQPTSAQAVAVVDVPVEHPSAPKISEAVSARSSVASEPSSLDAEDMPPVVLVPPQETTDGQDPATARLDTELAITATAAADTSTVLPPPSVDVSVTREETIPDTLVHVEHRAIQPLAIIPPALNRVTDIWSHLPVSPSRADAQEMSRSTSNFLGIKRRTPVPITYEQYAAIASAAAEARTDDHPPKRGPLISHGRFAVLFEGPVDYRRIMSAAAAVAATVARAKYLNQAIREAGGKHQKMVPDAAIATGVRVLEARLHQAICIGDHSCSATEALHYLRLHELSVLAKTGDPNAAEVLRRRNLVLEIQSAARGRQASNKVRVTRHARHRFLSSTRAAGPAAALPWVPGTSRSFHAHALPISSQPAPSPAITAPSMIADTPGSVEKSKRAKSTKRVRFEPAPDVAPPPPPQPAQTHEEPSDVAEVYREIEQLLASRA